MAKCLIRSFNVISPLDIVIAGGLQKRSLLVLGLSQTTVRVTSQLFVVQNGDRCAFLLYARTLKDYLVLDFTRRRAFFL